MYELLGIRRSGIFRLSMMLVRYVKMKESCCLERSYNGCWDDEKSFSYRRRYLHLCYNRSHFEFKFTVYGIYSVVLVERREGV